MLNAFALSCLAAALPLATQAPEPAPVQAPAGAAQPQTPAGAAQPEAASGGSQTLDLKVFPTRKTPFLLEGKMTVTMTAPTYVAQGGTAQGALLGEGLKESRENPQGGRRKSSAQPSSKGSLNSNRSYSIQVPPGAKLKVALQCRRLRSFSVRFVSDTFGRTEDPGLFVNKLNHREDAAFYQNKGDGVKTIHCILEGVEPMQDEPYTLVFTDY